MAYRFLLTEGHEACIEVHNDRPRASETSGAPLPRIHWCGAAHGECNGKASIEPHLCVLLDQLMEAVDHEDTSSVLTHGRMAVKEAQAEIRGGSDLDLQGSTARAIELREPLERWRELLRSVSRRPLRMIDGIAINELQVDFGVLASWY